ncbi:molybdenum ABC transporter ATP-binding protein [Aliiglaciecola sp. 3_MG-2023]|uniref:molybdenum ABC transporter ATP-binding protein n=1 Tax=Aliiglaciecola sp. 3_MG-2023 TaxID=3062644 RepID=UPI0026E37CAE|nr:molybdenum ABC transporter ATP-binding protein [Aliiglaciecola sp. 3_MG-2023]MDO6693607.1 molybdenum ABC transporter ATP-binding protein [Aliiglaciecola sp. 3_MG-2023]
MSLQVRFMKPLNSRSIKVDLDLKSKGVTVLFGPSGAGKTTLLRVIAGLDNLTDAQVIFEHNLWQNENTFVPPQNRHIGMVFQQPSLFEHLNVEQNIYFYRGLKNHKNREQRFNVPQLIELLKLTPLLRRAPNTLSGGEQQRVAIVRALATQPDLLLMDEPLSALDDELKSQFLDYLEPLLEQISIPVIYVTHSKSELARLAKQVVLMDKTGVTGQGTTSELLTDLNQSLTLGPDLQSVLSAKVDLVDVQQHVSAIETPAGRLWVSITNKAAGQRMKVVIHAKDVSVSLTRASDSSILNVLPAQLLDFKFTQSGSVILKLKVGSSVILSQITQKSFQHLKLAKDLHLFAQIKGVVIK